MEFYKRLSRQFPHLKLKLLQARIPDSPEYYLKKTVMNATFLGLGLCFVIFTFISKPIVFVFFPIIFIIAFFYLFGYVDLKIERMKKEISKEVVYAGRFLIIELESGVPVYKAFKNIARNYEVIGRYFSELVERIDLGTGLEDALNELITVTPSPELRKMLWQLLNSIKTGSEASSALSNVIDQIVREQQIAVKEYGRKLNPLAMFYMMIAIIVPSLGTIMLIVLTSFLGFQLSMLVYFIIACLIGFMQFMFLAVIKSSRPPMDM
ncbi:type II secretion system F family protein [Candidatus Woesearchaeota archaeon]|nr:type II secretion system F family protein [Candidatus Woesearchaeota archaeon]